MLDDYEIVELLLFNSIPRKDTKPLAKQLLQHCTSIGQVINMPKYRLEEIKGIGASTIALFKLIQEVIARVNKEQLINKPMITSQDNLITYLRSVIGYSTIECFYTLYLDNKHSLIIDKLYDHGTVNAISVYPREIVKDAVYHDASSVILVHNHPSGITNPSEVDLILTRAVQEALNTISVKLTDHIIISSNSYFSFRKHALI
jgi:DNA repair protein RadC